MAQPEPPEAARTTDPRAEPGRPDQSSYAPALDNFSEEPATGEGPPADVVHPPDIEPISGPVHTEEKIEESAAVI